MIEGRRQFIQTLTAAGLAVSTPVLYIPPQRTYRPISGALRTYGDIDEHRFMREFVANLADYGIKTLSHVEEPLSYTPPARLNLAARQFHLILTAPDDMDHYLATRIIEMESMSAIGANSPVSHNA